MPNNCTPCPWCGGKSRVNSDYIPPLFKFKAQVECTVCGAKSPSHYDEYGSKAAETAIERWADMFDTVMKKAYELPVCELDLDESGGDCIYRGKGVVWRRDERTEETQ